MAVEVHGQLEQLVRSTHACHVVPARFFVAWQGVLTVAFTGFPPQLARLKTALTGVVPLKENPGSLWPKVTLGCLRDGVRLTPDQLDALLLICREYTTHHLAAAGPLLVRQLHVVLFRCRSLERVFSCTALPLAEPVDTSSPEDDARAAAAAVAAEADDVRAYWFHVSKDGQRGSHYRGDAAGATLVAPVGATDAHFWYLDHFRREVDAVLGHGVYEWFDDASLHMTIRALL